MEPARIKVVIICFNKPLLVKCYRTELETNLYPKPVLDTDKNPTLKQIIVPLIIKIMTIRNQGRGNGRGGRGQGRGRGGYRTPASDPQEVPMLRYGPANNWTLFQERMGKSALEKFGDLGRLIETEAYYDPPIVNRALYDLANDPDGMNKVLLQEALKARQKNIIKMEKERSNFYGYILVTLP